MFAWVRSATVDGEDQPSPKLGLHHSRNTAALRGRWSKPSHGDAQQHQPRCKEMERMAIGGKKNRYQKGKAKGRRWDQQQPCDLYLLLPSTRHALTHGWTTGPGPAPSPSSLNTLGCSPRYVFPESQSILLDIGESHQAPSPQPPGTDLRERDHW